jgi:predicted phosphodiesterase
MTTAVVADLHLGTPMTVLERPHARARLVAELERADEAVLLGDVVDLRHAPLRVVLERARPVLEELGRALAGRRVTIVPGNHDHALAAPLLERRRLDGDPLALEARLDATFDGALGAVADALAPAEVSLAYPGVRLRDDVYATHGHYLDCHLTVPRAEVVFASAVARLVGGIPARAVPEDYEAVLAPVCSFAYELAQRVRRGGPRRMPRVWRSLRLSGWRLFEDRTGGVRRAADLGVTAAAVTTLNRLGLGPFNARVSSDELGRATIAAMDEVVRRLELDAAFVVFGHTHRPGAAGRLVNAGSWSVSPTPPERATADPYRAGTCVLVDASGPPRLVELLDDAVRTPEPAAA